MGGADLVDIFPTRRLAERATAVRYEEIEPDVVECAKQSIADAVALGLYGAGEACAAALADVLDEHSGAAGASAFGSGRRLSREAAALFNGTAIHAIDFDDTYEPGLSHLTATILAAALAIAEVRGCSGADLLTAYIAGYDAAATIALMSGPADVARRGFHPTGCFGTYGAAVAGAHLLGLDTEGMTRAIGLAATQAAGLMANNGTMAKPLQAGKAAANGVLSGLLSAHGFTCATDPLSGRSGIASYSDQVAAALPDEMPHVGAALRETTIKLYPSCWLTHGAVEAAISLHAVAEALQPVVRIQVEVTPYAKSVCDRPAPESSLEAKFSLQHVTALALRNGNVSLADFDTRGPPYRPALSFAVPVDVVGRESMKGNAACVKLYRHDGPIVERTISRPSQVRIDQAALRRKIDDVLQAAGTVGLADSLLECVHDLVRAPSMDPLISIMTMPPNKRRHAANTRSENDSNEL